MVDLNRFTGQVRTFRAAICCRHRSLPSIRRAFFIRMSLRQAVDVPLHVISATTVP